VTAPNQSPPQPPGPEPEPGDLVPVFVTNGVRTSAGAGPGVRKVPRAEAGALIAARVAIAGERPPPNWAG